MCFPRHVYGTDTWSLDDSDLASAGDELLHTLKGMGEISIKAYKVTNLRENDGEVRRKDLCKIGTIPEKALKGRALTHSARYVTEEATSIRHPNIVFVA
jgi:hypothetical protein